MAVTVEGIVDTQEIFLRLDMNGKRRVKQSLIEKAYEIRDLARKMAPRDEGFLEDAIKVRGDEAMARDELGRFARVEVEVYIDMDMDVERNDGRVVKIGDYAYFIHEHLTPAGSWQLGEESQAKQAGQQEVVGGAFMDRAVDAMDKKIDQALAEIVHLLG
jgi:CO dehydrogenase/acetyl-CoA synthase gamma subunit (corrinoid Fe-S protein)